jgi:hypothetical protein
VWRNDRLSSGGELSRCKLSGGKLSGDELSTAAAVTQNLRARWNLHTNVKGVIIFFHLNI